MPDLDDLDKRLLNAIQSDFPLAARPYAALAERAGFTEAEVMARVAALKRGRIIRQIYAIFDTRALGYQSQPGRGAATRPSSCTQAARSSTSTPASATTTSATMPSTSGTPSPSRRPATFEEHIDALHRISGADVTRLRRSRCSRSA